MVFNHFYEIGEKMSKFFVSENSIQDGFITITGEDAFHISRVLRIRVGEHLFVCDQKGTDYECVVEKTDKDVLLKILSSFPTASEPKLKITLYQGVPKSGKMDLIVQKATEVGVCEIIPVSMKNCVGEINKSNKIDRLNKISKEAAIQSGRGICPVVRECMDFKSAINDAKNKDKAVILYEDESHTAISDIKNIKDIKSLAIFIGPEGGLTKEETEYAKSEGIISVTLGKRILRTETAGIVASAVFLYESGDMK